MDILTQTLPLVNNVVVSDGLVRQAVSRVDTVARSMKPIRSVNRFCLPQTRPIHHQLQKLQLGLTRQAQQLGHHLSRVDTMFEMSTRDGHALRTPLPSVLQASFRLHQPPLSHQCPAKIMSGMSSITHPKVIAVPTITPAV
ncbi:unnamed protein product [Rhizoctonia solani]|uniref:Uncharacterized protein n=1 Tax=Rhizoctonia solani TaxID=456999 RepID=A0A8H2X6E8_9AGAM|nr:unnamed protein product [Rhizoctonia solani]